MSAFPLSLLSSPISTTALSLVLGTADFAQPPRMTRMSHSFASRLTASATLATPHNAPAPAMVAGGPSHRADSVSEESLPPSPVSEDALLFTASDDSLFSTAGAPSTVATSPGNSDDWQSFDTSKRFVFGQVDPPSSDTAFTSFDFVLPNSPAEHVDTSPEPSSALELLFAEVSAGSAAAVVSKLAHGVDLVANLPLPPVQFVAPRPVPSRTPGSIVSIDSEGDLYDPPSISLDFLDDSQLLSSTPPPAAIVPLFHPKPVYPAGNNLPTWINDDFDAAIEAPKRAAKIRGSVKSLSFKVSHKRECIKPAALPTPEWLRADFFAGL
ncbi:hypothetical protein Rhopal_001448-T1 [Rhodotorula paludigena]|uniref:Uncharacterized protein n=1 Tax=Rhodotorula paludigena TaxID=86838 RepID=A0AAV5GGK7_9BASI|nr:hypothetical protein Rhopal_001448-T1 [Rhodotorula paludigena]